MPAPGSERRRDDLCAGTDRRPDLIWFGVRFVFGAANRIATVRALPDGWSLPQETRARAPDWFNAPVPPSGGATVCSIVGLAPGPAGRQPEGVRLPATYAGDLLYATLARIRFRETGTYAAARPTTG